MLKKVLKISLAAVLAFALAASPALATDCFGKTTGGNTSQDVEKQADSWRFSNGKIDGSIDNNTIREKGSKLQNGTVDVGGGVIAWSKVDSSYYNSKGNVIPGAFRKGMDVSAWQKTIDWASVKKKSDVNFVIIRCGYGSDKTKYDDTRWLENVNACEKYKIPYGVYLYSYADSVSDAKSEAEHVLRLLRGHKPDYPVFYDLEDDVVKLGGKSAIVSYATTFCNAVKKAGYTPGIYASLKWFNNYLNDSSLQSYQKWIAQWNPECTYVGEYRLWQCTSSGSVAGVSGRVDLNFEIDFSKATKALGKGTYTAKTLENLNFRTGPGTKYKKKGTLPKNQTIIITATKDGWGKLLNGYYVYLKYTKKIDATALSAAATKAAAKAKTYKVKTTEKLNYRTGPGTKYKIKGTYPKGKKLTIVSKKNGWGKMKNGHYVYLKYTKKI